MSGEGDPQRELALRVDMLEEQLDKLLEMFEAFGRPPVIMQMKRGADAPPALHDGEFYIERGPDKLVLWVGTPDGPWPLIATRQGQRP